jgi:hypothetical protein
MESANFYKSIFSEKHFDTENQEYAVPFKETPYKLLQKTHIMKSWCCPYKVDFKIDPFLYANAQNINGYLVLEGINKQKGHVTINEKCAITLEMAIELKLVGLKK